MQYLCDGRENRECAADYAKIKNLRVRHQALSFCLFIHVSFPFFSPLLFSNWLRPRATSHS